MKEIFIGNLGRVTPENVGNCYKTSIFVERVPSKTFVWMDEALVWESRYFRNISLCVDLQVFWLAFSGMLLIFKVMHL